MKIFVKFHWTVDITVMASTFSLASLANFRKLFKTDTVLQLKELLESDILMILLLLNKSMVIGHILILLE